MNADPKVLTLLSRITLPSQTLEQLSFCEGSKPAQVSAWAQALPLTRISYVSGLLYKALPEITRLKTAASHRLAMLESLRPATQHCVGGLSQSFLNQPLILPEAALKTATVAQALQKHMTNAYLMAVRDACLQGKTTQIDQAALAVHRAMTGLGLLLLRSYQLYAPTPGRLWDEIHSLYLLAEYLNVHQHPVQDPLPDHEQLDTPEKVYLRLLLLASARPNQLRQDEVSATYSALNQLAPLAQLTANNSAQSDSLFAVLLHSNRPPLYRSRLSSTEQGEIRELNTRQLVSTLEAEAEPKALGDGGNRNSFGLTPALTRHLISAWHILAQRAFERREINGQVELTIGLTNLHYYLAGNQPFALFLNQTDGISSADKDAIFRRRSAVLRDNPDKVADDDPWSSAFDVNPARIAGNDLATFNIDDHLRERQKESYAGQHPTYFISIIDVSPGGYCLEWRSEIPSQMKAGELLGVREEGRTKWSIGVVRWVQQTRGATQLGIQLLAPQALPAGAALVSKTGGFSEYLRALEIPALKAINQPETLITNTVSFREYAKVRLFHPDGDKTIQLTRRVFSTGAISQFTYRELVSGKTDEAREEPQDFDAIWKS